MFKKKTHYELSVTNKDNKCIFWTVHRNSGPMLWTTTNTKYFRTKKQLNKELNYWLKQDVSKIVIFGFVTTKSGKKCILNEAYEKII